ncbi:PAS domain S-box protein [bacterium]|nr:PAS domain S-box protein [bacterium]
MSKPIKVLLIEDDPGDIRLIQKMLAGSDLAQFDIECSNQLSTGLGKFSSDDIDMLLLDLLLPDSKGFNTFSSARNKIPGVPIIVITGVDDKELAVKVIKEGAQDYLVKWEMDGDLLAKSIFYAIERKDSEKKLVQYASQLEAMVENSIDGIALSDINNGLVYINKAFAEIHGYTQEEMKYFKISNLHSPEQRKDYTEIIDSIKTRGSWKGELDHFRKDGTTFPTQMSTSLVMDAGGKPSGMLAICRDITEQKYIEAELRDSRETLRNILESSPNSISVTDSSGNLLDCNLAMVEMHGFTVKEELIGRNILELIAPVDRHRAAINMKKVLKQQTLRNIEYSFLKRGGIEFPVELSTSVVQDTKGEPITFVNIIKDITEHKKTLEALKISEEKWSSLAKNAPNTILITDEKGKIKFINHTIEGFTQEETIGKTVFDFIDPQFHDMVKETIIEAFKTGEGKFYEITGKGPKGTKSYYKTHIGPITEDNEVIGITHIVNDITEVKQAEKQILSSLKEKEALLREIHHRVKNNLQVISSLFRLQSTQVLDPCVLEILRETRNRIDSMSLIYEKLYQSEDLTKIEFPKYIRSLVSQIFASYKISSERIKLSIYIDEILMAVDAANCCSLIINELLSNILKHAFPNEMTGEIYIEFKRIESTTDPDPNYNESMLSLIVSDNGIGMPDSFDLDNTDTLGIQIVLSMVEQLKGEIEYIPSFYRTSGEKQNNKPGTTFKIWFKEAIQQQCKY